MFNISNPVSAADRAPHLPFWQISARKIGGLFFLKLGRLNFSFSISREYRPL